MSDFLGIDTSCYTTSVSLIAEEGDLLADERIVLHVPPGHRGLSQSEMVYQHVRNLPVLFSRLPHGFLKHTAGIGVSAFPRRRQDSYMPAFLAGRGTAEILSLSAGIPLWTFSHQENHAMAAIREFPSLWGQNFYLLHLSGGTNDLLRVRWNGQAMDISEITASEDITAGQFIDRTGVALGLSFPAGAALEKMAECAAGSYRAPVSDSRAAFSFSGPETQVRKDILSGEYPAEEIAKGVLVSVSSAIKRVLTNQPLDKGMPFAAVGGVMSDRFLRDEMKELLLSMGMEPHFASPEYSSDNASGNAFGASMMGKL